MKGAKACASLTGFGKWIRRFRLACGVRGFTKVLRLHKGQQRGFKLYSGLKTADGVSV